MQTLHISIDTTKLPFDKTMHVGLYCLHLVQSFAFAINGSESSVNLLNPVSLLLIRCILDIILKVITEYHHTYIVLDTIFTL